jgi:predicted CXXCH cytochrome family protein
MRGGRVIAVVALALSLIPASATLAADEGCGAAGCHTDAKFALAPHRVSSIADRGRCTACHDSHAPGQKGTVKATYRELCAKCHKNVAATHGKYPVEDQRCSKCHLAHAPSSRKRLGEAVHEVAKDCSNCHQDAKGATPFALLKKDPALCFDCHSDVEKAAKGKGAHAAVSDGTCTSCHSPHASWQHGMLLAPQGKLCAECHSNVAEQLKAPVAHVPVKEGNCTSCHDPHASPNPKLFKKDGLVTCGTCHREVASWFTEKSLHQAVRAGECLACHVPHAGKPHLLRADGPEPCLACHAALQGRLKAAGAVVHPPVLKDCYACHRPHSSGERALLKRSAPELCLACHDVTSAGIVKTHGGYAIQATDCTGCHDPHAGAKKGLLNPEPHMPFGDKMCDSCHYPPATPPVYPVQKPGGLKNCGDCHDFSALTKLAKPHDPVKKGECFKCHVPHAALGKHLLNDSPFVLCTRCHDLAAANAKDGHERVKAGPDCTSCHMAHEPSRIKEAPRPPPSPAAAPAKKGPPAKGAPAKGKRT